MKGLFFYYRIVKRFDLLFFSREFLKVGKDQNKGEVVTVQKISLDWFERHAYWSNLQKFFNKTEFFTE